MEGSQQAQTPRGAPEAGRTTPMTRNPMMHGTAAGLLVPLAFLAPTFLWGPLAQILADGRTYFLLPAMALLLLPGGFLGALATRFYSERRDTWRFAAGLL